MAILRAQLTGSGRTVHRQEGAAIRSVLRGVFEGIAETPADLELPQTADYDPGSLFYCLSDGGLYVKNSLEQWEEVGV